MGRVKTWALAEQEQGFSSNNTRVCSKCIDDVGLRRSIRREGAHGQGCSYCPTGTEGTKSVRFNDFMHLLVKGIGTEWGDPANEGLGWRDGQWDGATYDAYDFFQGGMLDLTFRDEGLIADVVDSFGDRAWCRLNPYQLSPAEALSAGWKEFVRIIKHESRYVFFRMEGNSRQLDINEIPPAYFLDALGSVIASCRLYKTLDAGTTVQRIRLRKRGEKLTTAGDLGPPPLKYATAPNRMSAAGISAFYGAFDKETAIAETVGPGENRRYATLGHFRTLRELRVVDLTTLPRLPSIFEENARVRRDGILFLREFLSDFRKPVKKDGKEHIEYVPTQVVAEYLRFVHRSPMGHAIDGIVYTSSRKTKRDACVIFVGPDGVRGMADDDNDEVLALEKVESFSLKK
ncbi:HEPN-associated N-terminal domain-containing protein [Cupriavidus taiwanensis]|uniref:HEPN-associated N-terminal domain-containing protein n=1 Tax=Cupriavidus taiwanensis TaxID=164546 RepID=UPI000E103E11|nr:HEPN-associated N-terminal domain-containing protein [Cupriavidus taiwanensis]SPA55392.1 conserved protein of unknown function [Cupriavidus taiwanensis]